MNLLVNYFLLVVLYPDVETLMPYFLMRNVITKVFCKRNVH